MKHDALAKAVLDKLLNKGLTLATAESCTGGYIGKLLTDIPGSSAAYLGGVISYTNGVKEALLGVPHEVLEAYSAVSEQTARCMAEGARRAVGADIGVGVTGLAGPDGDGSAKPVGLVYAALCDGTRTVCRELHLTGDRSEVRLQAAHAVLELVLENV